MANDYGSFWEKWDSQPNTPASPYASFWDQRQREDEERRRREEERRAQVQEPLALPRSTAVAESTAQLPTAPVRTPAPTLTEEPERSTWDNPAFSVVRGIGEGGARAMTFGRAEPGYVTPEERAQNPNAVAIGEFVGETFGTIAAISGVGKALGLGGTVLAATAPRALQIAGRVLTGPEAGAAASVLERLGAPVREGVVFATHGLIEETLRQWKAQEFDIGKLFEEVGKKALVGAAFGGAGAATQRASRTLQIGAQGLAAGGTTALEGGTTRDVLMGTAVGAGLAAMGGTSLRRSRARPAPEVVPPPPVPRQEAVVPRPEAPPRDMPRREIEPPVAPGRVEATPRVRFEELKAKGASRTPEENVEFEQLARGLGEETGRAAPLRGVERIEPESTAPLAQRLARVLQPPAQAPAPEPPRAEIAAPGPPGEPRGLSAREPWQMTLREYLGPEHDFAAEERRGRRQTQYDITTAKKVRDISINDHREAVRQALAEGKPVPPEVLAAYPELQPKAGPSAFAESVLGSRTTPSGRAKWTLFEAAIGAGATEDTAIATALRKVPERIAQSRQAWEMDNARTSPEGAALSERENRLAEMRTEGGPPQGLTPSAAAGFPARDVTAMPVDRIAPARYQPATDMPMRLEPPTGERAALAKKVSPTGLNPPKIIESFAQVVEAAGKEVPIRLGHMRTKGTLGEFNVHPNTIHVRIANDIVPAIHETAHALEKAMYGWDKGGPWSNAGKAQVNRATAKELVTLGKDRYPEKAPYGGWKREGFARFMELYATDRETARARAPSMMQWFDGTLLPALPEVKAALTDAIGKVNTWQEAGAAARVGAMVVQPASLRARLERSKDWLGDLVTSGKLKAQWVDKAHVLERLSKAVTEARGKPLEFAEDPFLMLSAYRKTGQGVVDYWVTKGMTDFAGNKAGPSLSDAIVPVRGLRKEFGDYLVARRAVASWNDPRGPRNPGIPLADAEQRFRELDTPEFQKAAQLVYGWQDGILNYVAQSSPSFAELVRRIRVSDPGNYVPLFRIMDDAVGRAGGGGGDVKGGPPIAQRKGSGRQIVDPFDSMVSQAVRLVNAAQKRHVLDLVLKVEETTPDLGKLIEEVPRDRVPGATVQVSEVVRRLFKEFSGELESVGVEAPPLKTEELAGIEGAMTFFVPAVKSRAGDIIPVWKNDTIKWYQVKDPKLWGALESVDQYRLPGVLNLLFGVPARTLRLGATALNPRFALLWNPERDAQFWMAHSAADAKPQERVAAYFSALREVALGGLAGKLEKAPVYDFWLRTGGKMAQPVGPDILRAEGAVRELFQGHAMRTVDPRNWYRTAADVLQFFESVPRVAEVKLKMKELGIEPGDVMIPGEAAELVLGGKRATTDFTAAGAIGEVMNQMTAFANPAIQGLRTTLRRAKDDPARLVLTALATQTLPALAQWWAYKDEEWWGNLPYREKFMYHHIQVGDNVVRVPTPFEVGVLFLGLPKALLDQWYRNDPDAVKEWAGNMFDVTVPPIMPTTGTLLKEQWQNRQAFFDRPIVPPGELDRPPEERFNEYTTRVAVKAGKVLNVSPRRIEHAIYTMFGGVGGELIAVAGKGEAGETGQRRELEAADIPVFGRHFLRGGTVPPAAPAIGKLYDAYEKANQRKGSLSNPETPEEAAQRAILEDAVRDMAYLRGRVMGETENDIIRELNQLKIEIARDALNRIRMPVQETRRQLTPEERKEQVLERQEQAGAGAFTRRIARARFAGEDEVAIREEAEAAGLRIGERDIAEAEAGMVRERLRAAQTPEEREADKATRLALRDYDEFIDLRAADRPGDAAEIAQKYGGPWALARAAGRNPTGINDAVAARRKTRRTWSKQKEEVLSP